MTADGDEIELIFGQTINTRLVSSMKDKKFTDVGLQEATDAAKTLMDAMKAKAEEQKLVGVKYYIVGSSGVAAGENKDELATSVKAATGIDMDFIDPKREGFFGAESSIPTARLPISMYIDIGSGNTKLGCVVGASDLKNYKSDEIKFGSVSGRNEARKRNPDDVAAGIKDLMKDISATYMKDSEDIPCLRNRQRIYWTGGAAWATATFTHPERALMPRLYITRKDLDAFLAKLTDGTWNQGAPQINYLKSATPAQQKKIREKAEKERQDVMNIFVREDLLSGVSIMKTVLDASNPSAILVFARESGFIYGYAEEKFMHEPKSEHTTASR
jgi:exopolyphosphatase/pppGpp-phosphohydrolase